MVWPHTHKIKRIIKKKSPWAIYQRIKSSMNQRPSRNYLIGKMSVNLEIWVLGINDKWSPHAFAKEAQPHNKEMLFKTV